MNIRKMLVPAEKCFTDTTFSMPRVLTGHIAKEERHRLRTNKSNVRRTGASGRGLVAHAISMWKEAQRSLKSPMSVVRMRLRLFVPHPVA
jgi:hypothetical protein